MKCYECGTEIKTKYSFYNPYIFACPNCGEKMDIKNDYEKLYSRLQNIRIASFVVYFIIAFVIYAALSGLSTWKILDFIWYTISLLIAHYLVEAFFSPIYSRMINNYFDGKDFWGRKETSEK